MRTRIVKMMEQAIRTAGVLKLADVCESLQAKLDALKALEVEEGEEFDKAIDEATASLDEATAKFESASDKDEDVTPPAPDTKVSEAIERLERLERQAVEREQREKVVAERNAKVGEVMEGAEGLSESYSAKLRTALEGCGTAAEVASTYAHLYPVMKEASEAIEAGQFAIHVRKDEETMSITGEAALRPQTTREVVKGLVEGLKAKTGWEDTGAQDPSNKIWVFNKCLENYAAEYPYYLESMTREGFKRHKAVVESTSTSDVAVGAPFILPIFRELFPKLIAMELCSVQPIDRPDAKVFFYDAKTDPGALALDTEANFDSTYADHTESSASAKIKLVISTASIAAVSKSVQAEWTTELAQDLQAYHSMNAESELMQSAADEIAREINYTILEDMRANASGSTARSFGTTIPAGSNYTGREWDQRLADFISRMCGDIAEKVYRRPNWLVMDPNTASRLSALNTFVSAAPDEMNAFSVDVAYEGVLSNRWKVYSVGWFTNNTIMCGYKGTDWKETCYIYAPYIPAYISPPGYNTSTLVASRAILTRFGKYLVNGDMLGRLAIASGAGTDLT